MVTITHLLSIFKMTIFCIVRMENVLKMNTLQYSVIKAFRKHLNFKKIIIFFCQFLDAVGFTSTGLDFSFIPIYSVRNGNYGVYTRKKTKKKHLFFFKISNVFFVFFLYYLLIDIQDACR